MLTAKVLRSRITLSNTNIIERKIKDESKK